MKPEMKPECSRARFFKIGLNKKTTLFQFLNINYFRV